MSLEKINAIKEFTEAVMVIPYSYIDCGLSALIEEVESGSASIATIKATTEKIWNKYIEMEYASTSVNPDIEVEVETEVFLDIFPEYEDLAIIFG